MKDTTRYFYGVLASVAFGLNLFWEVAQMFAYEIKTGETLAGSLIFCTLAAVVDALVTISIYGFLAQILKRTNRFEFYFAAAFLGASCAVFFEWLARFSNLWSYNKEMFVIPLLETGLLPFAQLTTLVPIAIWLTGKLRSGRRMRGK